MDIDQQPGMIYIFLKKAHELVKLSVDFIRISFTQLKKNNSCLWNVYLKPKRERKKNRLKNVSDAGRCCFFFLSSFAFSSHFCPFVYKIRIKKKLLEGKQLNKIVIYSAYIYIKASLLGRKVSWSGTPPPEPLSHLNAPPPPIPPPDTNK